MSSITRNVGILLFCAVLLPSVARGVEVKDIQVLSRGDREVDEASVLSFISMRPGDPFAHQALTQDLRNLRDSGRFSYVDVSRELAPSGVTLIYTLTERARIRRLRIVGAEKLGSRKVRELLDLGVGDYVDEALLGVRVRRVIEAYREKMYPFARITTDIVEDPETGLADVEIYVREGDHAGVRDIHFEGNSVFSDRELRHSMAQKRRRWYSWFTGGGVYDPDALAHDQRALQERYLDQGYLDAQISMPQARTEEGRLVVDVSIEEGKPYAIQSVTIEGVTLFPREEVFATIGLRPGEVASSSAIREASNRVRTFYTRRGYVDTRVRVDQRADPETRQVDLVFNVQEGGLVYIRDIRITGNTRTKDKVVRRELAVYPGEPLNEPQVRTSERRLMNLGFFERVNSSYFPTVQRDRYDVVFDVEEKRTGQFMVGAGFSSIDQVVGFTELGQGNFDLFGWPHFTGAGQKLKLRATMGTKRKDYELSFVEPWFLDRRLSLGVDLFQNESRYYSDDYRQRNLGGSVSLTKPLTSYDRITFSYSLQQIDIFDVAERASEEIKLEEGKTLQSSLGIRILHDTRDSYFVPTRGNRTLLSGTLSGGVVGGDVDIYEISLRSSQFWPVWFDHVLSLRGEVAVVDSYGRSDRVRIFDRKFLGGPRNLRAFKYRHVGPVDDNKEPLGGNTLAFGTVEYEIPLARLLRLAAFYDMGMVYKDAYSFSGEEYTGDFNSNYGVGIRLDIPGFPLRFDYAWPLETGDYNDRSSGRFSFLIGYVL